jgi:uncharacterized delta-60 repeat protein
VILKARFRFFISVIFLITVLTGRSLASAGDLDQTFGTQGKVTTQFNGADASIVSVVTQSDGKIIVAGNQSSSNTNILTVVRYNSNGTLDTAFGNGGIASNVLFGNPGFMYFVSDMALQPDGKIVVVGARLVMAIQVTTDLYVARFNSNGTLDSTFGTGGEYRLMLPINESYDPFVDTYTNASADRVVIQSDGKILVGGVLDCGSGDDRFMAVRFQPDGTLDTNFGTSGVGGIAVTPNDINCGANYSISIDLVSGIVIQSDNKIVMGGTVRNGNNRDFALVRFNPNGSVESAPNNNGIIINPISTTADDWVYDVAIQRDNKILLAGVTGLGANADFAIARFNTDLSFDTSFDGDGKLILPIGSGEDVATSLHLAPDGTIVVGGFSSNGTNKDFVWASFNSNGSIDTSLNLNGYVRTQFGAADDGITAIAAQNSTRLVVAGFSRTNGNKDFAVARYEYNFGVTPDLVFKMISYSTGLVTGFGSGLIYYSPDGLNPGGGGNSVRVYAGTQTVVAMIPYQNGVITAFSGNSIYYSPNGQRLGGGGSTLRSYQGPERVTAMIPYNGGVITAFAGAGIFYSPDGLDLHGVNTGTSTTRVYSGTQTVVKMIPYNGGVMTAFSARWIYYSPDGQNLGGGGSTTRAYTGTERLLAMTTYQGSVITAFESGNIYKSPDGQNLGGGGATVLVCSGRGTPLEVTSHQNGVLTALTSGGYMFIYYSPDGTDLGGVGPNTRLTLFGNPGIIAMIPYQSGAIVVLSNKAIIYSPDGRSFAPIFGGNPIRIY